MKAELKQLRTALKRVVGPPMKIPAEYDRLTPAQRRATREEYARRQDGKCWYCQAPLAGKPRADVRSLKLNQKRFPKGFFENGNHLHHSHATGMTIGAVHAVCNAVLWSYHGE